MWEARKGLQRKWKARENMERPNILKLDIFLVCFHSNFSLPIVFFSIFSLFPFLSLHYFFGAIVFLLVLLSVCCHYNCPCHFSSKHPSLIPPKVLGGGQPHQAATEAVSLHKHGAALYHLAVAWIQKYSGDCCINSLMGQNNKEHEQKYELII